jgi:hypothetical protein
MVDAKRAKVFFGRYVGGDSELRSNAPVITIEPIRARQAHFVTLRLPLKPKDTRSALRAPMVL